MDSQNRVATAHETNSRTTDETRKRERTEIKDGRMIISSSGQRLSKTGKANIQVYAERGTEKTRNKDTGIEKKLVKEFACKTTDRSLK